MGQLKNLPAAAVLAALCGLIFFSRLHTYDEPLDRDLTTYAVIGHEMLAGKELYRDLWDHKPPAIHVTYAVAELIAGYGRDAIFLLNIGATLVTLFACYWAGSAGGGRVGGCFAAAFWALTAGNLGLEGNQPNTEVFLNAFLTIAFAMLVRAEKNNFTARGAVIVGMLFALASLYKQIVVVQAVVLAIAYLACGGGGGARKRTAVKVAVIGLTSIAIWALVFAYFFARGSGPAFVEAVFSYNSYYATDVCRKIVGSGLSSPGLPLNTIEVIVAMAAVTLTGLLHGLISGPRRRWILLGAFAIATQISVVLPGWFFRHYYQLWLPVLAIGAGWTVASLRNASPPKLSPLVYLAGAAACALLVIVQLPDYLISASDWSSKKYGGIFLSSDRMAREINKLLEPNASFYEWGNETGLYFASRRHPASGILYAYPMLGGPLADRLSQRLLDDLDRGRPELVVISRETLANTASTHPVVAWFEANYRPLSETSTFILLARKESGLDRTSHADLPASDIACSPPDRQ